MLKFDTQVEQIKDFMIKWLINFGYSIQIYQWEYLWSKGLKFTLSSNLKENDVWYIVKIYKNVTNNCWKCQHYEGTFFSI